MMNKAEILSTKEYIKQYLKEDKFIDSLIELYTGDYMNMASDLSTSQDHKISFQLLNLWIEMKLLTMDTNHIRENLMDVKTIKGNRMNEKQKLIDSIIIGIKYKPWKDFNSNYWNRIVKKKKTI